MHTIRSVREKAFKAINLVPLTFRRLFSMSSCRKKREGLLQPAHALRMLSQTAHAVLLQSSAFLLLKAFGCALEPLCLAPGVGRQPVPGCTQLGDFCTQRDKAWLPAELMPGEFTPLAIPRLTGLIKSCCRDPAKVWHCTPADHHRPGQAAPLLSPFGTAGAPHRLLLPSLAWLEEETPVQGWVAVPPPPPS